MQDYTTSFGIGFVAGMRTMTACAALTWAASTGRTRDGFIPTSPEARTLATAAALAEMAGDKMPSAPDRRIPPSFAARLVIGAVGGWALAGQPASPEHDALAGVAGALAGTLLGRAIRGPDSGTASGRAWGLAEDVAAVCLAAALVNAAEPQRQS
ncbi:hypothetical protein [Methylorubrum extorquens]|uniref:DUF4126 domain-containing protein n=1 Tax=Methylorubrum extorquens (strain ATCC 14718 / DSM 1338 / JCM 2805 / NCIMB 9133 / AM1) TaxID=272630 RepID=C5B620_METEA|nr:hypothetical protein [Methylorubrum extorquens]ACS43902.1 conserved hypothetical protein [Methylorubrum extorquens AM1]MCP1546247.1 putative membrane protein [Methylorubrum extorquens]MCP1590914.1 putative membrane protein [Methylorubrum extorquens]